MPDGLWLQVAAQGSRILARLKVYVATARFQVQAEEAVQGHANGSPPSLRHVHAACTQAGGALARLAKALLSCPSEAQPTRPSIISAFSPDGKHILDHANSLKFQCLKHVRCSTVQQGLHHYRWGSVHAYCSSLELNSETGIAVACKSKQLPSPDCGLQVCSCSSPLTWIRGWRRPWSPDAACL